MRKELSAYTVTCGFVLVEWSIAFGLFVLLIGLIGSHYSFLHKITVCSEVRKLASAVRSVQRFAMMTNKQRAVVFDFIKNTYTVNNRTETLSSAVTFGFIQGVKGPPSNPMHFITQPCTFKHQKIVCAPNGTIFPGTLYLMSNTGHWLYALSSGIGHVSCLRTYFYADRWLHL